MSLNRKIFVAGMALSFLMISGVKAEVVAAEEEVMNPEEQEAKETSERGAVLFRIENITPIANKDGLTDKCSYIMTVFNRMDKALKSADMVLEWKDKLAGKYRVEEGELKIAGEKEAVRRIINEVTIDNIAPHTQKSFEQNVSTDRCYLLLDNVNFKVTSCITEGLKDNSKCTNKFNYIDSKNPEYYSEFKDLPESVLAKQAEEEKERELSKVTETVKSIMDTMSATEKELDKIK